jgi:ribosomal protein S18 acetylase RimI-like enzyme
LFDTYLKKHTQTNNYLLTSHYESLIVSSKLFAARSAENMVLLAERNWSFQVYFFINNFEEGIKLSATKPLMLEIVYRGEANRPNKILQYLENNGFKAHLTRDNLTLIFKNKADFGSLNPDINVKLASSKNEAVYAHDLFKKDLDNYTGDLKTQMEIDAYVADNNILCSYFKGDLCGALQFEIRNKIVWLGHIVVNSKYRGLGIANVLVDKYITMNQTDNDTRYQLWVINDNEAALHLYKKFGFVYSGRSTVSAIKL